MTWYTYHDLTLEVHADGHAPAGELAPLLHALSFVCTQARVRSPTFSLAVRLHQGQSDVPASARQTWRANGVCGFEQEDHFYLTDGASLLHLRPAQGWA